jgi:hypothetical protein
VQITKLFELYKRKYALHKQQINCITLHVKWGQDNLFTKHLTKVKTGYVNTTVTSLKKQMCIFNVKVCINKMHNKYLQ